MFKKNCQQLYKIDFFYLQKNDDVKDYPDLATLFDFHRFGMPHFCRSFRFYAGMKNNNFLQFKKCNSKSLNLVHKLSYQLRLQIVKLAF